MTGNAPGGAALTSAFRTTGLDVRDVWVRYLGMGGNADEVSVGAQLHGLLDLPAGEYNVLAHTLNEALDELPPAERGARVPYLPVRASDGLRRSGS